MSLNPTPINNPARTARNRANAVHSTGPKTEAGKKRSSLNALRHGLTGHTVVLPSEDLAAYQEVARDLFDEFKPVGPLEKHLVQFLADATWRLHRIPALEITMLALCSSRPPEANAAPAATEGARQHIRVVSVLSLHGARLTREFEKNLDKLETLQKTRRALETRRFAEAAALLQMDKKQGLPYNPAEDGFVFSCAEIETHIRRRDRLKAAAACA